MELCLQCVKPRDLLQIRYWRIWGRWCKSFSQYEGWVSLHDFFCKKGEYLHDKGIQGELEHEVVEINGLAIFNQGIQNDVCHVLEFVNKNTIKWEYESQSKSWNIIRLAIIVDAYSVKWSRKFFTLKICDAVLRWNFHSSPFALKMPCPNKASIPSLNWGPFS